MTSVRTLPLPSSQPGPRAATMPRTGTTHRLDRTAALAYYVALAPPERSYAKVAQEFGTSDTTIRKWARRDDWPSAAAAADRRATAKALEVATRTREQRAAQTVKIRDLAGDRLEARLTPDKAGHVAADDSTVVQVWREADRQYRLDIGEVTDRISIPEVRDFVLRLAESVDELLVAVVDETLTNGRRAVVVRAFRERLPQVLELAAGAIDEVPA